jgi:hypothetical protein
MSHTITTHTSLEILLHIIGVSLPPRTVHYPSINNGVKVILKEENE